MKMKHIIPVVLFAAAPMVAGAQAQLKSGIDLTNLDNSVRPADDFFQYACGGWMKKNPLPAAYSRYGSFDKLAKDNNERINSILTDLLKNTYPQGSTEQKLSDFYKLAMDSVRRNQDGVKPVMPLINELEGAKTVDALHALQLKYAAFGYGVPMGIGFGADEKNAKMNILNIYQGGLVLGQKEYYLDTDSATTAIRDAYKKHVVRMFQLFGFTEADAQKKMENILKVETALAKVSKSRTELRDVEANYNKMTLEEFEKSYPHVNLTKMLNAEGVKTEYFKEMVVGQPSFVKGADDVLAKMTADELRAYMEWDVILSAASYLSDDVQAANFDFFGRTMSGRKEDHPRWKRATSQVEGQMGEALGKMYVERYFPASSKERMEKLVKNLQVSLAERIKAQDWMSDATKQAALDKLNAFYVKIGYPNQWKDMSGLVIDPKLSYYENVQKCREFWNKWDIDYRAGKPVDKEEWFMTPQTVNAYYNPTTNEICFPAGILQVPFFDPTADDAFNYGAIGVVIGHEMTHGFDDQGRHYDKNGNMTDWWTASDAENFNARAEKYADFFSAIKVLPDLNANGKLTLGENLADHGGLEVAFNAYKNATKDAPLKTIDGLTPDQRFFLAYAGVWAANITEEEIRQLTKMDPHSLGEWRVNGALPHINAWYEAFNVKSGDKMYLPENERLKLW
ncbi:M13 family metallopeptidase [Marseilla massiliensis]|uniref:M13 family metallopeptidase n=1 Tax=Marseilla massiliensis TaxID=1841864 RepID=A0A939B6W6_9BACT|nr:M13 family metallopeptidase [Marseilla massiliensis]MBM6673151.1 M13 family metallopeptidase [Marseilla massiliensis]